MIAAILTAAQDISKRPLRIDEVPRPTLEAGYVLLKVRACGVCRTDLHIVEGELPPRREHLIPGHQIVGDLVEGATADLSRSERALESRGLAAPMEPVGTAAEAWRTFAMLPCSLAIR